MVDRFLSTFDLTAIDVSGSIGLTALGLLTTNILLGLLISTGYNPLHRWPRRKIKLFTLHNWTGYLALAAATIHPLLILLSSTAGFLFRDIVFPIWSPTQPLENTLGALAFYLVAFVVLTSYFRRLFGHHSWKLLHFTTYAAAATFFVHGLLTDPLLKSRPVDWIDAEKVFVEACGLIVVGATIWRIRHRRRGTHPLPERRIRTA